MLEQLARMIDREPEIEDCDADERVREPGRPAIVRVVSEHRLADAETPGELPSSPAGEGADRIDAVQDWISIEFHVRLPWLAANIACATSMGATRPTPARDWCLWRDTRAWPNPYRP